MRRRLSSGRGLLLVVVGLLMVGVGVGSALGAIPNNGVYNACLTKSTGAVQIIDHPKVKCTKGQRLIKWGQQGPAGPLGPQGAQGPAGPADWNAIPNMPAGFADGVDNEGVTGIKLTRVNTSPVSVAAWTDVAPFEKEATVDCPAGSRVTGGGGATPSKLVNITSSWPLDADSWRVIVTNTDKVTPQFVIPYAICLSIEPAGAFTTAKKGLLPATVKKAMKKRDR